MYRAVCSPLVVALAALGLLLVVLEAVWPGYFLYDDNATWFSAAYAHDFRTLTQTGRIAEVNFYQYGGEPFLQEGQTAVLYPPVYLAGALARWVTGDARWTIDWLAALHLALAVAGFYAWLREGGVDAPRAALAGLAWAFSPFVWLLGADWIPTIYTAAWLPWLFWALDGVLDGLSAVRKASAGPGEPVRPARGLAAFALAGFLALFLWQGYVQWVSYAILFLALYFVLRLVLLRPRMMLAALGYLGAAVVLFAVLAMPLVFSMLHGMGESGLRAQPLPIDMAIDFAITLEQFLWAQVGQFSTVAFGSSAMLFCPAAFLVPWMLYRMVRHGGAVRRRLVILLALAVLAVIFSTRAHLVLSLTPFFGHYRWPFKVFILADFFLVAAMAWSFAPAEPQKEWRLRRYATMVVLVAVLVGNVVFSVAQRDNNRFSPFQVPPGPAPLAAGMDPNRGRVVGVSDYLTAQQLPRFYAHCFGTYYAVPSIGGYDPLVGTGDLLFSNGLDYPNIQAADITADFRDQFAQRAVRYWLVGPDSRFRGQVEALGGFKLIAPEADRLVYEDTHAQPLAFDTDAPRVELPTRYAGNSMLIQLSGASGIVAVSVGPTDGWHYRIDNEGWRTADYHDFRLYIPVSENSRVLEVSYFDPHFRMGIVISFLIMILSVIAFAFLAPVARAFFHPK